MSMACVVTENSTTTQAIDVALQVLAVLMQLREHLKRHVNGLCCRGVLRVTEDQKWPRCFAGFKERKCPVRQAGLYTQFLVQERSEPSTENRVHHSDRHPVGIARGRADVSDGEKRLCRVGFVDQQQPLPFDRSECRDLLCRRRAACPSAERLLDVFAHFSRGKIARHGENRVSGSVMRRVELLDTVAADARQRNLV